VLLKPATDLQNSGGMGDVPVRWSLLIAGLIAELSFLTVRFHGPGLSPDKVWWVQLTAHTHDYLSIVGAFAGAFAVLLAPRLKLTIESASQATASYAWWPWVLLHLGAFAGLYAAAAATFGQGPGAGQIPADGLLACLAAGLATLVFWLLACAPMAWWGALVARERRSLAIAFIAAMAAWLGGQLAEMYWRPLASGTLFLAERLLRLGYADVVSDPAHFNFGTSEFLVNIAPECSGYEGIGLVTVFLALYLWLFRSVIRLPHALLLFPIGIAAVWLANVARIALLVAIGTSYSADLAAGGFHSHAGWLSFVGLALGFIAITHRMQFFSANDRHDPGDEINPIATALLVPFLVLMGSLMITAAFTQGFDRLYPIRIVATVATLLYLRALYAQWDWSWSWDSVAIGAAAFIVWIALARLTPGDDAALPAGLASLGTSEAAVWIGFRVFGSVFIVPLVEEMAFRGYLLRRLAASDFTAPEARRFTWTSFLFSSVAFGLLHGRWLAGTLAGMAYALAVYRRGKLGDAVVAHMITNGLIAVSVLAAGAWSLWS